MADIRVILFGAQIDPAGTAFAALGAPGACSLGTPQRGAGIVIEIPKERALRDLRLVTDPAFGPAAGFVVEGSSPDDGRWSTIASGCRVFRPESSPCRIARKAPIWLRVGILPAGDWVGHSAILVE